ncbi:MAG: hypothetical protein LBU36_07905 [Clostridiales bacterium]|jgi:hypothetical protein|nr:hypothetical protein [Clostridiales bacterium]
MENYGNYRRRRYYGARRSLPRAKAEPNLEPSFFGAFCARCAATALILLVLFIICLIRTDFTENLRTSVKRAITERDDFSAWISVFTQTGSEDFDVDPAVKEEFSDSSKK